VSNSSARQRLYAPRTSRVVAPRVDPEAVGQFTESVARFFGTGRYLLLQTVMVVAWIVVNVTAVSMRWYPYPFILLNLAFSTQAAYAAPLILLAQNRQENRDRIALGRIVAAPNKPRPTPNIWPASWLRCDCPSVTWQRRVNTCVTSWKVCATCWRMGSFRRGTPRRSIPVTGRTAVRRRPASRGMWRDPAVGQRHYVGWTVQLLPMLPLRSQLLCMVT
jgi:hypothetical protein